MGRSVPTVNSYISGMYSLFQFAVANGYAEKNPIEYIKPLKKSKAKPDPLTKDEFIRLIGACKHRQIKNLWSLAVYTGMRHGELCALAWEDIDLKKGTITVNRNLAEGNEFTPTKTNASQGRVIQLISPAIEILRDQSELTRMLKPCDITMKLREYGKTLEQRCTFVFNPSVTAITTSGRDSSHYSTGSIGQSWESAFKRAGLRQRKAYQSRHTYACWSLSAGANPNFIASQMGHSSAQMVYQVYGSWMQEDSQKQVEILNKNLSDYAPWVPHGS